jgi:hypothetical protein
MYIHSIDDSAVGTYMRTLLSITYLSHVCPHKKTKLYKTRGNQIPDSLFIIGIDSDLALLGNQV